jgi:hypothetical protein
VVVTRNEPVLSLPLVATVCAALLPFVSVQLVALVDVQVTVSGVPDTTGFADAVRLAVTVFAAKAGYAHTQSNSARVAAKKFGDIKFTVTPPD